MKMNFRPGIDIDGRPDFGNWEFGVTHAKHALPYVHSTWRNACLVHKVADVRMRWYDAKGSWLQRRDTPSVIAETVCGQFVFLGTDNRRLRGKMCKIPDPNAVLCGRCHGELPTFSAKRKWRIKKRWAKDHLGCKGITEVIGPYQPPAAHTTDS